MKTAREGGAAAAMANAPPCTPEILLALLLCPGVGPVTAYRALLAAQCAGTTLAPLLGQSECTVTKRLPGAPPAVCAALARCGAAVRAHAANLLSACAALHIQAVARGAPGYPALLAERLGQDAPLLLFIRGSTAIFETIGVGIVGTRTPSAAGIRWAAACARETVAQGAAVVSGGAAGVDWAAHCAALEAGGHTVAALPEGLLAARVASPLAEAVARGAAVLLGEAPPDAPWETHRAVARNRLIAAMSQALCVIEPRKHGGSLCTARWGLAQGVPVYIGGAATGILREYTGACSLAYARGDALERQLHAAVMDGAVRLPRQELIPTLESG